MDEDRETLLEFPCSFPIKAIGRATDGFDSLVVQLVRRHVPDLKEAAVTLRQSSGGKWLSVTVVIQATNKAQIDAIYRDLSSHEKVVWAL